MGTRRIPIRRLYLLLYIRGFGAQAFAAGHGADDDDGEDHRDERAHQCHDEHARLGAQLLLARRAALAGLGGFRARTTADLTAQLHRARPCVQRSLDGGVAHSIGQDLGGCGLGDGCESCEILVLDTAAIALGPVCPCTGCTTGLVVCRCPANRRRNGGRPQSARKIVILRQAGLHLFAIGVYDAHSGTGLALGLPIVLAVVGFRICGITVSAGDLLHGVVRRLEHILVDLRGERRDDGCHGSANHRSGDADLVHEQEGCHGCKRTRENL